jgi:hypothetical protein
MKTDKKNTIKKWIKTWEKAGPALDEIRIKELRSKDYYEKNLKTLNEMLKYAHEHRTPRLTSGLVEQQKLFMKLHKKQMKTKHE